MCLVLRRLQSTVPSRWHWRLMEMQTSQEAALAAGSVPSLQSHPGGAEQDMAPLGDHGVWGGHVTSESTL